MRQANCGLRKLDVSGNDLKVARKTLKEAWEANKWLTTVKHGADKDDVWHKKIIYDNALAAITHDVKDLLPLDHRRLNLSKASLSSLSCEISLPLLFCDSYFLLTRLGTADAISLAPIFEDVRNAKADKKKKGLPMAGGTAKAGAAPGAGELSLEDFVLFKNSLTELDADVCKMHSLVALCLLSNKLRALPADISELQHLEELDIGYNQIADLPASIAEASKPISFSPLSLSIVASVISVLLSLFFRSGTYSLLTLPRSVSFCLPTAPL